MYIYLQYKHIQITILKHKSIIIDKAKEVKFYPRTGHEGPERE